MIIGKIGEYYVCSHLGCGWLIDENGEIYVVPEFTHNPLSINHIKKIGDYIGVSLDNRKWVLFEKTDVCRLECILSSLIENIKTNISELESKIEIINMVVDNMDDNEMFNITQLGDITIFVNKHIPTVVKVYVESTMLYSSIEVNISGDMYVRKTTDWYKDGKIREFYDLSVGTSKYMLTKNSDIRTTLNIRKHMDRLEKEKSNLGVLVSLYDIIVQNNTIAVLK